MVELTSTDMKGAYTLLTTCNRPSKRHVVDILVVSAAAEEVDFR